MLIKDWLTHSRAISNVIHGSDVVTSGGKHFKRGG
jgi:hypothetical protein